MPFEQINTTDPNLQKIQDNIAKAFAPLDKTSLSVVSFDSSGHSQSSRAQQNLPFSGGGLVRIPLVAGKDNLVPHALQRVPQVWILARLDTNTTVWEQVTSQLKSSSGQNISANSNFLNLWCGTDCIVTVWVA